MNADIDIYMVYTSTNVHSTYENLHHSKIMRMKATAPSGAYCRNMAWKLMLRAALRYFSDSERKEVDKWDMPEVQESSGKPEASKLRVHARSSESPLHNNSSMFFVMILVTSCNSSFSLSMPDAFAALAVRVSW